MTKEERKALYNIAATAFVEAYKSDIAFYELGKKTGIYLEFENDAASSALEKILTYLFPQDSTIINALCELAQEGEVTLHDLYEGNTIECYTINEIWDIYTKGE